jgi:hypothetical protein
VEFSDTQAYENAAVEPAMHRVFYQQDDTFGGRRIQGYGELLADFSALAPACQ